MNKTISRITALLLAVVLCIGMLPLSAFAEEAAEPTQVSISAEETEGEEIVLPVEEPVDQEPQEEITAALEDTPDSEEEIAVEAPVSEEDSPFGEVPAEDGETAELGESEAVLDESAATENIDGGDVIKVNNSSASAGGPRKAKGTGEKGKLRVLYYTMDDSSSVNTTTMGNLCGVPAHSIIMADGVTQKAAYCLNHDRGATEGYSYTWKDAVQSGQSDVIGTICALGFQYVGKPSGNPPTPWGKGDSNDKWLVTQLLVWAACNNYITIGSDHLIHIDSAVDSDMAKVAPRAYSSSGFSSYYASLKAKLLAFRQIPSFASYAAENGKAATAAKPITLKWDGEKYTATATDKNGVLKNYNFTNALSGVTVSQNGNSITLSTATEISGTKSSSTVTYRPQGGSNALAYWTTTNGDTSQQDFAVLYNDGYPDAKELSEYSDYRAAPTKAHARKLILTLADEHPELFRSRSGYISYMANRPGVEKIDRHGLFSSSDKQPDIEAVQRELDGYSGNVWTHIISLRREDAERLGYTTPGAWQALLKKNQMAIAQAMRIRPENFRWYAAFHNEGHHPHVHMVAWSADPKEAYLSPEGIQQIKSVLARDIFQNDLLEIYQQQTSARDALRQKSQERIAEAVDRINQGLHVDPLLEEMLARLAAKLRQNKGKKVYGYLPKGTKKLVDAIVDELGRDPNLAILYDEWYQQRRRITDTYMDKAPEKKPLSQVEEFKPIRNAVVREALRLIEEDSVWGVEQDEDQQAVSDSYRPHPYSLTAGAVSLLKDVSQIFQDVIWEQQDPQARALDSKLRRKDAEKKLAQGQKLG